MWRGFKVCVFLPFELYLTLIFFPFGKNWNFRYPDWFLKKEVAPTAATPTDAPVSACLYTPQITAGEPNTDTNHQSCFLSRPFIDAWSLDNHVDPKDDIIDKCPPPTSSLNSILPLTLSVSAGLELDQQHHHHEPEDPTKDLPEIRLSSSSSNHQPLSWMSPWVSSSPGGPLAEALCLGMGGTGNGAMGSHSEDHLVSPHGNSTNSSTTTHKANMS